jgi:hypothetical protein
VSRMRGRRIRNRFLYTNPLWISITLGLFVIAPVFHFVAINLDWYANPSSPDLRIDVYTHSVSSIAVIAGVLNLNFGRTWGRRRRYYWGIPIIVALAVGIVWEVFEEVVIRLHIIDFYNTFWNAVQDVYMDVLGGIAAGFFADEVIR